MSLDRRAALRLATCLPGLALARAASAQGAAPWPSRPIRVISGSSPGSITDLIARIIQPGISRRLGQPLVIENRPGAGGNIATGFLVQQPADGHTLMVLSGGIMTLNRYLYRELPFDPERDVKLITRLTNGGFLLAVSAASGITTPQELVEHLRRKGDAANYGSPGIGFVPHLGAEMFLAATGVKATHIPYRGSGAVVQGLLSGEVDFLFDSRGPLLSLIQTGEIRVIGNGGSMVDHVFPDLPLLSGIWPGLVVQSWTALAGPGALPNEIVRRLDEATRETLAEAEVTQRLRNIGGGPAYLGTEDFVEFFATERERAARTVALAGITQQ